MKKLTIITTFSNFNNVINIGNSILSQKKYWDGELYWNIVFQFPDYFINYDKNLNNYLINNSNWIKYLFICNNSKKKQTNFGKHILIKKIKDGWIYQLENNNKLYPYFIKNIHILIENYSNKNLFIFWQKNGLCPENINDLKFGIVDSNMYLFNKSICHNVFYPSDSDGESSFLTYILKNKNVNFHIEKKYYVHRI